MVILTHLEKDDMEVKYATDTKETMKPSFLEKKHVRSLFPAPCWKVFFFASRKRFISSVRQNRCVCGRLMTYLKKGWRRWRYIQMMPLKNITKLFCEVIFGQDFYTKRCLYFRGWQEYQEFGNKIRALYIHLLRINGLVNVGGPENLGFEAHDTLKIVIH